jgi:hypothetical protein
MLLLSSISSVKVQIVRLIEKRELHSFVDRGSRGQGRADRTTRCVHAYHMWLSAPELPPNLGPADKNSTQLVEPC